jgi:hypothetical protein
MMTLKLWRALNNPPATHPIFVRTVLLPRLVKRRSLNSASVIIGFIMSMSEFMPTVLIFLMPILLGFCGLIYGLDCAVRVSQLITFERKNNTYELLVLCPPGALAVCWAMCTSLLYQQQQFGRLHEIVRTSARIAFASIAVILVLFIGISVSIIISASRLALPIITPLINAEAVVVLIYSEYVQSTIIGCLIGLIIPTFANGTMDSFLYAPAVFLLIKIGSYAFSILVGFSLFDGFYQQLGVQSGLMDIVLTLARVVIIVAVQDVVIRLLWQVAIKRTDSVSQDTELALYP